MKSNHTPGTTRHIVNKKFQLKGRHGANAAAVAPNTAIDK